MGTEDIWSGAAAELDDSVVRHAPDETGYHPVNSDHVRQMGGSPVGRGTVTIPAANRDGSSKGFNPLVAGPMHVDPGAPDGGCIFDPRAVSGADIENAVATSSFPHQAFYRLSGRPRVGVKQAAAPVAPIVPNYVGPNSGHLPGVYVTPSSAFENIPLNQPEQVVSQHTQPVVPEVYPHINGQPQPHFQPVHQVATAPQIPTIAPMQDPGVINLLNQLANSVNTLHSRMTTFEQQGQQQQLRSTTGVSPVPMPVGPPPRVSPRRPVEEEDFTARPTRQRVRRDPRTQEVVETMPDEPPQTVRAYEEAQAADPERLIAGFETLGIRWLTGPVPSKAKQKVVFKIPNGGTHQTRYHDVVVTDSNVILIYDTRYEDGQQFLPPELGEDVAITLELPSTKDPKSFVVHALGQNFTFGVFDFVVLVRPSSDRVDSEEEDE